MYKLDHKLIEQIKYEDLPEDLQMIADITGSIEMTLKLNDAFWGTRVYFGQTLYQNFRERFVLENYNGNNARELARYLKISDRFIESVVKGKPALNANQITLDF
jgi:Mor family transcriptional regulator